MVKIGFDLDGVLADQTLLKQIKFKELFGIDLERWQVSSNVIDDYVPDKTIRRAVGSIVGTSAHNNYVEQETEAHLMNLINLGHDIYIVSRRGKSEEGIAKGYDTIKNLKLDSIFKNRILFCSTEEEKIKKIVDFKFSAFIDDRVETINELVGKIDFPLLYDSFNLAKNGYIFPNSGVVVINSIGSVIECIK